MKRKIIIGLIIFVGFAILLIMGVRYFKARYDCRCSAEVLREIEEAAAKEGKTISVDCCKK